MLEWRLHTMVERNSKRSQACESSGNPCTYPSLTITIFYKLFFS
jgi:hypothetical protein